MAAGTEYSNPLCISEEDHRKGDLTAMREDKLESVESMNVMKMRKPPRHLPPIGHCVSSDQLASTIDMVRKSISLIPAKLIAVSSFFCTEFAPLN